MLAHNGELYTAIIDTLDGAQAGVIQKLVDLRRADRSSKALHKVATGCSVTICQESPWTSINSIEILPSTLC